MMRQDGNAKGLPRWGRGCAAWIVGKRTGARCCYTAHA